MSDEILSDNDVILRIQSTDPKDYRLYVPLQFTEKQYSVCHGDIRIKLLRDTAKAPKLGNPDAVGWDVYYSGPDTVIHPGDVCPLETGIAMEIPPHLWIKVESRSGLAAKYGLFLGCGVIDPDYRGELKIVLLNAGPKAVPIATGDRIAQLVPMFKVNVQFTEVKELGETARGEGGFGSTGLQG